MGQPSLFMNAAEPLAIGFRAGMRCPAADYAEQVLPGQVFGCYIDPFGIHKGAFFVRRIRRSVLLPGFVCQSSGKKD